MDAPLKSVAAPLAAKYSANVSKMGQRATFFAQGIIFSPTPRWDYNPSMRIDYFEHSCGNLLDSDDATKALGTVSIFKGRKTVGDIRKACEGHPKDASIYPESDGSGFFITEVHGSFLAA